MNKLSLFSCLILLFGFGVEATSQSNELPYGQLPENYLISMRTEAGAGFMDTNGVVIIPPKYYISDLFKDGLTTVSVKSKNTVGRNSHYGAYNYKGEMIVPIGPYFCRNLGNGIIAVDKGFNKALYNSEGKQFISCDTCTIDISNVQNRVQIHYGMQRETPHKIGVYDLDSNLIFETFGTYLQRMDNIESKTRKRTELPYYVLEFNRNPRMNHILNLDGTMFMDSIMVPIGFYDNLCVLAADDSYALVDSLFNEIIPFSEGYSSIARFGGSDKPLFGVKKNELSGVVDQFGLEVLPIKYQGNFSYHQGFMAYYSHKTHKYTYLGDNGERIGRKEWEMHETFVDESSDRKWFRVSTKDRKFGFVDKNSNISIPLEYDFLSPVTDFRAVYFKGDESGYINIVTGEKVVINQPWISEMRDGVGIRGLPQLNKGRADFPCAQVTVSTDKVFAMQYQYIDSTGKPLSDYLFDWAYPFYDGQAKAMKNCQIVWLDKNIEPAILGDVYLQSDFKDDLAVVKNKKRKYGLIKKNGELVIPCEYDEISLQEGDYIRYSVYNKTEKSKRQSMKLMYPDLKEGALRIRKGRFWGLAKSNGSILLEPIYKSIRLTDNKLLYVVVDQNDKIGLLGLDGSEVLPIEYDHIGRYAPHGLFAIVKDGVWGKVSYTGRVYWPQGY